jgi:lipid-A-disaccharide synthase-like uncharacterized protein
MFALPEYWWVLALALGPQLVFLGCLFARKGRGAEVANAAMPLWAVGMLCFGALVGVGYALVQSDWVFLLGQSCVLLIGFARIRHREHGENGE